MMDPVPLTPYERLTLIEIQLGQALEDVRTMTRATEAISRKIIEEDRDRCWCRFQKG